MPNCAICNTRVTAGLVVHDDCLARNKELLQENARLKSVIKKAELSIEEIKEATEILEAYAEGRLVVLPVFLGQKVYCLHHKYDHVLTGVIYQINYEDGNADFRRNNSFCVDCGPEIEVGTNNWPLYLHYTNEDVGKAVFHTLMEAEGALAAQKEGG